jgi:Oxidoreductase molybdopterin binding domain
MPAMKKLRRIPPNFLHRFLKRAKPFFVQSSGQTEPGSAVQRRRFIGWLAGLIGYGLFLKTGVITALAQVRRLLARNTDLGNLIYEDPAGLDIRNLPVTELINFGVSGTDDHIADMDKWHLQLDGLVRRPGKLSYAELMIRSRLERKVLLICPGTFAYVARWQGFSLWDLLQEQGIFAEATHVNIKGPPGEYRKVVRFPLDEIRKNRVFLAYGANGRTLPKEHGFPLRAVAEYHVGAKWVKYVYGIEVVHREEMPREKTRTEGPAFFP